MSLHMHKCGWPGERSALEKHLATTLLAFSLFLPPAFAAGEIELVPIKLVPKDPYEAMQPAGNSYLGNRGPNLQLPERLSIDDKPPIAYPGKPGQAPKVEVSPWRFRPIDVAASALWALSLYFGIFDVNLRTNAVSSASGDPDDVRPSDWVKVRVGNALGMGQSGWVDDWTAPAPLEAFAVLLFLLLGACVDRALALAGLGDGDGFFAVSSGASLTLWAGVYELGRTQQRGYRLTREEKEGDERDAADFATFAAARLRIKPTGRVHVREVLAALRRQVPRFRTPEQASNGRLEGLFRRYARSAAGTKGRQGFFKGVELIEAPDAFGVQTAASRRAQVRRCPSVGARVRACVRECVCA